MNEMDFKVIGGIITFLLSANVYLFRAIQKDLHAIKIEFVKLSTRYDLTAEIVREHAIQLVEVRGSLHTVRNELQSVKLRHELEA